MHNNRSSPVHSTCPARLCQRASPFVTIVNAPRSVCLDTLSWKGESRGSGKSVKNLWFPLSGVVGPSGDRVCVALWIDLQEEVLQRRPSNETILDTKLLIRKLHLGCLYVCFFYFDKFASLFARIRRYARKMTKVYIYLVEKVLYVLWFFASFFIHAWRLRIQHARFVQSTFESDIKRRVQFLARDRSKT